MKNNFFICIVLIASILVAQTVPNKRQTSRIFKDLVKNDIGKDIFQSIQLELSAGNEGNMVDTILTMLYELRDSIGGNSEDLTQKFFEKKENCDSKLGELQSEIKELESRISAAQERIPTLQEQANFKSQQVETKQAEINQQNSIIVSLNEANNKKSGEYKATVQQHEDMKNALKKAKELITQLSTTGFLQQRQTVLDQLQSHTATTLVQIPNHQHSGIFKMLVKLSQDVGIQADQDLVAEILAIIDELIAYEDETAAVEQQAEQKRLSRFNFDLTRATAKAEKLEAAVKDLIADAKTLNLRLAELQQDIDNWGNSIEAKQEQYDLQQKTCNDAEAGLNEQLENFGKTLELINQVIEIFENEDIQTIKQIAGDTDIPYGL